MIPRLIPTTLLCCLLLLAFPLLAKVEIEGVYFDRQVDTEPRLELQGYGLLRYRLIIKAYVAAYYQSELDAPLTDMNVSRKLEIEYFHAIKAEDFARVTRDGVKQNTDSVTYAAIEENLEEFLALYQSVEPGDRYALTWLPETGISLLLNGESLGSFDNAQLAQALFAIWIGDNPGDRRLKNALLGQS
ncbi:Chalcone isomerase-like [Marinospirillum celere]|uniref:Chalcone isomerase-like n=1 Tax=Marinospirillum celere TaxID=1122252 RepID=A0A1I1I2Z9_9GAMM|nr:chalcone isomerase family protein [Marinospirillum celere]SFC30584.1 Chalcone isomerase-like [Marinospirillum celere]